MNETEANGKDQKPKLCWLAVASPLLVIFVLCACLLFSGSIEYNVFMYSLLASYLMGLIAYCVICQSQGKKYGRGYAISGIILAIFLFLPTYSVRPPILTQKRLQQIKRAEGKAMVGAIATVIKMYAEDKGPDTNPPSDNDFKSLGFEAMDLEGTYWNQKMLSFKVQSLNPLRFTVTAINEELEPSVMTLDQDGNWTEGVE